MHLWLGHYWNVILESDQEATGRIIKLSEDSVALRWHKFVLCYIIIVPNSVAAIAILWPLDVKSRLIGKDPDAGKDQRQKEKRAAENEMVR